MKKIYLIKMSFLRITTLTSVNTNIYFFDAFVFVQGYTRFQILLTSVSLLNKALCYQKSGLPFALIIASIFGFFCSKSPPFNNLIFGNNTVTCLPWIYHLSSL